MQHATGRGVIHPPDGMWPAAAFQHVLSTLRSPKLGAYKFLARAIRGLFYCIINPFWDGLEYTRTGHC